jgi:hypothetical protein
VRSLVGVRKENSCAAQEARSEFFPGKCLAMCSCSHERIRIAEASRFVIVQWSWLAFAHVAEGLSNRVRLGFAQAAK